jgi:hypothetical protein
MCPFVSRAGGNSLSGLIKSFNSIIHYLISQPDFLPRFREQFRPQERGPHVAARNLNAAFLIALSGSRLSHPVRGYLASMSADPDWHDPACFYLDAVQRIEKELERADGDQPVVAVSTLRFAVQAAALFSDGSPTAKNDGEKLVRAGSERLGEALADPEEVDMARYLNYKEGWDLFYDILDALEKGIAHGDRFSGTLKDQTLEVVQSWRGVSGK